MVQPEGVKVRWHARTIFGGLRALLLSAHIPLLVVAQAGATASAPKDWYHVVRIDDQTFELSQPKYWPQADPSSTNVSYLLLGGRQALLFDTGPGVYSIRELVRSLTRLPVLVIPSHLHFDHVGDIPEFAQVALVDLPYLRAQTRSGLFVETENQYMLNSDTPFSFRVTQWIKDGTSIDLGGRSVTLLSTPGHTPDSVSLIDVERKRAFSGDLVMREAWALTEGADVAQMAASVRRILRLLPKDGLDFEGHREAPWLYSLLEEEAAAAEAVASGRVPTQAGCLAGQPMRVYPMGAFTFTTPPKGVVTLRPLGTKEDSLADKPCGGRESPRPR
jgi:glyoxylase-like metal-dependent hydrolase (beta-lactamase superfamily II)